MISRLTPLPPLAALRAFEAAARHCSFTRAAEELFVTQAAISHQIKVLEDWVGFPLFRRINNKLVLTSQGQSYIKSVNDGFNGIRHGTATLMSKEIGTVLTISALPNFALNWLMARLPRFCEAHPHIEIRLLVHDQSLDMLHDDIDVAIRAFDGTTSLHTDHLFDTESFPVASPALLARVPLDTPADLARHTLLHNLPTMEDWGVWAHAAGLVGVDLEHGHKFDSYALTMAAAAAGLGVAMGRAPFVLEALRDGRLVMPFDVRARRERGWCLVYAGEDEGRRHKIELFRAWILDEARLTREERA
ncbi:transcriptional regulator GcvA [Polaromonas sp. P1(28)-13]|nr:transcriptional regulator GcvA [Polaromonas sp. P1(28)-13]